MCNASVFYSRWRCVVPFLDTLPAFFCYTAIFSPAGLHITKSMTFGFTEVSKQVSELLVPNSSPGLDIVGSLYPSEGLCGQPRLFLSI